MSAFADLCDVGERNGLVVEIITNPRGDLAVWVPPAERREFGVGDRTATMRVGVVASPFGPWSPESHAGQLVQMLNARGYE